MDYFCMKMMRKNMNGLDWNSYRTNSTQDISWASVSAAINRVSAAINRVQDKVPDLCTDLVCDELVFIAMKTHAEMKWVNNPGLYGMTVHVEENESAAKVKADMLKEENKLVMLVTMG